MEFELKSDGRLRYANNSNYKSDTLIRKEVYVTNEVKKEVIRIILDSNIFDETDEKWPKPDKNGKQNLEIILDGKHISFLTAKIGSYNQVQNSEDPDGLRTFYYLVQDLKCFVFSLISLNFRVKPVQS